MLIRNFNHQFFLFSKLQNSYIYKECILYRELVHRYRKCAVTPSAIRYRECTAIERADNTGSALIYRVHIAIWLYNVAGSTYYSREYILLSGVHTAMRSTFCYREYILLQGLLVHTASVSKHRYRGCTCMEYIPLQRVHTATGSAYHYAGSTYCYR